MIVLNDEIKNKLIELYRTKNIALEGNIIKIIDPQNDKNFKDYLKKCSEKDKDIRRKRLEITKQIQSQNKELLESQEEKDQLMREIQEALEKAEEAKNVALNDLDIIQKRTQFKLINIIVKMAMYIIVGVGVSATILYIVALFSGRDTQIIGSTWSNMFGILLTNAFSIVGTIMGVKYASGKD